LAAKEKGWNAVGVDVGRETCAFVRELGLEVWEGDVCELPVKGGLDAVFVWNTFDQINEPHRLLRRLRELLKAGGCLVLRVPNGECKTVCVGEPRFRKAEAYNNFLTFPYLCGYNPASLQLLLGAEGFEVCSVAGDVILPLATKASKPCALREEIHWKNLVLRICRDEFRRSGRFLYPWMDVVARRL
jgi:SAM-dependent methyltransferase